MSFDMTLTSAAVRTLAAWGGLAVVLGIGAACRRNRTGAQPWKLWRLTSLTLLLVTLKISVYLAYCISDWRDGVASDALYRVYIAASNTANAGFMARVDDDVVGVCAEPRPARMRWELHVPVAVRAPRSCAHTRPASPPTPTHPLTVITKLTRLPLSLSSQCRRCCCCSPRASGASARNCLHHQH